MSEQSSLAEKREEAARVLREILDRMSVDAEVSAFDDGERIILDAHGCESGLVIGKKGATLDSLQYLVSRIVFRNPGEASPIVVDAEGYRGGVRILWRTWRGDLPRRRCAQGVRCLSSR